MWKWAGWFFVGLGIVGAALPVMPTVPFLLLAAFCFEKGSPELHAWLMRHPVFGAQLSAWKNDRVIRPRAKVLAVTMISGSIVYLVFFRDVNVYLKSLAVATCLGAIVFILCQKSRA